MLEGKKGRKEERTKDISGWNFFLHDLHVNGCNQGSTASKERIDKLTNKRDMERLVK
jgi:hypothetical protein